MEYFSISIKKKYAILLFTKIGVGQHLFAVTHTHTTPQFPVRVQEEYLIRHSENRMTVYS